MSKRFFYKVYTSGEVDFFDNEQEYVNEEYTCDDVGGLHPMDYWELVELLNEQQAIIDKQELRLQHLEELLELSQNLNKSYRGKLIDMNEEDLKECVLENIQLKEENKQLLYKLQQTKEYLQAKIDECKNHKKMNEIVFGVEQKVGYEKALLQLQEGLKRRWDDE